MSTTLADPPQSTFEGIYDVPEAARYLKAAAYGDVIYSVSSAKLIRWIRRGVVSPELVGVSGTELLIAFEDLISMRVIAALRGSGVSWAEIRTTERWLRNRTGAKRPFALEDLWTGQGQIYVDWTRRLLSASRGGQMAFDLLRKYLTPVHGLVFSETTGAATSWEPVAGIMLEPQVQFGSPCLKGTRIPTRTVAGMVEAGDPIDWVAEAYGLSLGDVKAACGWEASLRSN